jgi:hypothetical protein
MPIDGPVIAQAVRLVAAARGVVDDYAGPGAPVSADQLRVLLAANGCHVEIFPFRSDALGMTLPCVAGLHPVLVNGDGTGVDRRFALRHQVAHVLAADTRGSVCLAADGFHDTHERVADLFALADAIPGWWIAKAGHGHESMHQVRDIVARQIAEIARSWPFERVLDRATLRLRLFCDEQI